MKPFQQDTHRFMIHNYIIDAIMPALSPTAFKILMCAVRQTLGWVDKKSATGRRQRDRISYSQFIAKTGIKSPTTIHRALTECMDAGYLLRFKVGTHQGTGRPIFDYALNAEYEAIDPELDPVATTEDVVENPSPDPATTENGVAATTENGVATTENGVAATPENGVTKEIKETSGKKEERKQGSLTADKEIKQILKAQMAEPTFNERIQPLEFTRENGKLIIKGPPVPLAWASHPTLARQIAEAAGVGELEFIDFDEGLLFRPPGTKRAAR